MPRYTDEADKRLESRMQSTVVKQEGLQSGAPPRAVEIVDITNPCEVVRDYERDNALLKDTLSKKIAACDSMEEILAYKTRIINQQDAYIATLEKNATLSADKEKALIEQQKSLMQQISVLQEQLNLTVYLKQTLERTEQALDRANHTAGILSSTLAEERSAKRSRAD